MPILSGDIKLLASKVMDDVPNGGGGPTGTVIPDGASNAIFGDVTERQRAGGGVSIRQLHLAVQTGDTDAYMDPSIIVSQPPNDANVSITLAKCGMFAKRTEIANAIENYMIQGAEWGGYLLENHVAGQRSIQLFQRPGTPTPPIGRTLVLISDEGKPAEKSQYVRITRVEVEKRTFTYNVGSGYQDYPADVVVCDLTDALRNNFPGSPPDRSYGRSSTKTVVRDTTVADAATFYGATPLTALASVGDSVLKVASVYTQLVPSARTEVVALDQRPAAQSSITLATSPRLVTVGAVPHTMRIKIGQENRGFSYTAMLRPLPEPGTLVISYMALGNWYTVVDDGAGGFTGQGVGQVIYTTGSLAITLPALPDVGSAVIVQWGDRVAFTDRSSQGASVRAPEYSWVIDGDLSGDAVIPSSLTITYPSGGTLRTVTDNGIGTLTGDGTGRIDYASRTVQLRPTYMPDAGAQLQVVCDFDSMVSDAVPLASAAPDAAGFVAFTLSQQPIAGTLQLQWVTARSTSGTSGGKLSNLHKIQIPPAGGGGGGGGYTPPTFPSVDVPAEQVPGGTSTPPPAPQYRFRVDFAYSSNGTTVDPALVPFVSMESVTTFGTAAAAAAAMNAAFAAGPVPAGVVPGDVITLAGSQMRINMTNQPYDAPTVLPANFAHMKSVIYPGAATPAGGGNFGLPA